MVHKCIFIMSMNVMKSVQYGYKEHKVAIILQEGKR
jgi:hypothetical protein